ncbi:MAG: cache domain-containing protein [Bacteroidales bacterium]|nr:cache domain-containing protein [Bacteroidales bacterium]
MNIRTKIPLFTSIIVFITIVAVTVFSVWEYRNKTLESIDSYKQEQTEIIKKQLEDNVNSAYKILDKAWSKNSSSNHKHLVLLNDFPSELKYAVRDIEQITFGDVGYIWLNEVKPPYTVIMHPAKPEMNGTVQVFYIQDTKQNVYEAFADVINKNGDAGFLKYDYYKPGTNERIPKLSYIRLFEPLGWVIGTGVYVDYIDAMVTQKTAELNKQTNRLISVVVIFGLILISVASLSLFYFGKSISDSISNVKQKLFEMSKGHVLEVEQIKRNDELGEMLNSLNDLIFGLNQYADFSLEIGQGNIDAEFKPLSSDDKLGNSLLDMRESIKKASDEEEKRRFENERRSKANEGYAMFSELVRKGSKDIAELSYDIISSLVDMLGVNQGGIFMINDESEEKYLELTASVAYGRRKYQEKKIFIGDGLAGACAYEKKKIYVTNVPDNYAEIRSGLGTANPKTILIVPLVTEDYLVGVIELASLKEIDDFNIEFTEKVTETIAASLFAAKINAKTSQLQYEYEKLLSENNKVTATLVEKEKEIKHFKRIINDMKANKSILSVK